MPGEVNVIGSTGEEMTGIEDNSVDVVVVTLVLCSVGDAHRIMKQVVRVLVPVSTIVCRCLACLSESCRVFPCCTMRSYIYI